jgi:tetratricopeptide (TPR) repeat protein
VVPYGGTTVVMHSGGSGGFGTEFRRYPEKGYTLIVQSNWSGAGFELTNAIEALLLGLPYEVATERLASYRKAMDLQRAGNYEAAAARLDLNVETDDPHMPSLYQAARTRILGEFEQREAIALLDRYITLAGDDTQPTAAAAHWRQGVALEQLGEVEEAVARYRLSLELDPSFGQALEALERLEATE